MNVCFGVVFGFVVGNVLNWVLLRLGSVFIWFVLVVFG